MKNLTTKLLALAAPVLLALASCTKSDSLVTVSSNAQGCTLSATTTTPTLSKATLTNTAVTFTATAPNYGFSAAATNTLQIDVHSDNFATVQKELVLNTGAISQSFTVQDFNNLLLAMNLKTGQSSQIDVRIKSALSTTAGIVYSNVVTLTVTPFALVSYVYVPGAYQGWNPATADSLQSATGNGVYVGTIYFSAGNNQFLITPAKNWNNKYATNDAASTSGTSSNYTVVYNGSNNYYAPTTAGWYQVTLNVNNNTISIVPAAYYSIIGSSAVDWGTDVDMKFNNGLQAWTVTTALNATAGNGYKIRKNHDWTVSYGWPTSAASTTLTSSNGNNMSVTAAGTYLLTFAVNPNDATAATFTAVKQ